MMVSESGVMAVTPHEPFSNLPNSCKRHFCESVIECTSSE